MKVFCSHSPPTLEEEAISHELFHVVVLQRTAKKCTYILVTKHEGCTGRISARGLDSTDRAQRGPYKKDRGLILSQYGPEQAWLIRDLLHDLRKQKLQRHKCGIIRDNARSDT